MRMPLNRRSFAHNWVRSYANLVWWNPLKTWPMEKWNRKENSWIIIKKKIRVISLNVLFDILTLQWWSEWIASLPYFSILYLPVWVSFFKFGHFFFIHQIDEGIGSKLGYLRKRYMGSRTRRLTALFRTDNNKWYKFWILLGNAMAVS